MRTLRIPVGHSILTAHHHLNNLPYARDPPWPSGYDAWLPSVSSQVRVSAGSSSGLAWLLYKCAALLGTVCGPSATERPLGTIREE